MLTRFVRIQLMIFTVTGLIGVTAIALNYVQVPALLGIGRTTVTVELPAAGGLYRFSNVTYRGVQVGKVTEVEISKDGNERTVRATLSLDGGAKIPADVQADVHSVSAIGEQYVDLIPRSANGPYLQNGSVIGQADTTIPQPIGPVLDKTSELLGSLPKPQLHSLVDEMNRAFDGAEYDLQSLLDSAGTITHGLRNVEKETRSLIDDGGPLIDGQVQSTESIETWTRSLAAVSTQLVDNEPDIRTLLEKGPGAFDESSRLLDQLNPTIPILLANLNSISQLAVTYRPSLEQLLVLLPPVISIVQAVQPNRNAQGLGAGSFRITVSDPPACTVGFLPPSSWRPAYDTTTIDTPDDLYCKLPQDSPIAVRGSRNFPCMGQPGKRAPTAEICNSDQNYEALAPKQPVLGPAPRDPNLEAQGIPPDSRWFPDQGLYSPPGQGPPPPSDVSTSSAPTSMPVPPPGTGMDAPPPGMNGPSGGNVLPPPDSEAVVPAVSPSGYGPSVTSGSIHFAHYNPRTGEFMGSDGKVHRQNDLVSGSKPQSWRDLLLDGAA